MTRFKLFVALVAGIAFSLPVSAKMYKWVDDKGVTHYGETIPPEYANKDRSELGKSGRVIGKKEVLTPEERRTAEQADAKKRADEEAVLERKRRDKALVSTYSNEKEIDLARNRNLQQVEARIDSISRQLKIAEENLATLKKEADGYNAAGKKIPVSLQEDLNESLARLTKLQQDMEKAKAEKAALDARYDADKVRYKELTGK
jgi:chromosome segregation ATPase